MARGALTAALACGLLQPAFVVLAADVSFSARMTIGRNPLSAEEIVAADGDGDTDASGTSRPDFGILWWGEHRR